jgi:hypothetical protein
MSVNEREVLEQLASYDSETARFRPGYMAPRIICASSSRWVDGAVRGELLAGSMLALEHFEALLDANLVIAFANAAYDLANAAASNMRLLAKIFKALREKRIHDILIAQGLNDIFYGHIGKNPDGSDLRKPDGKTTNRYSLEVVHRILTGRDDAKANDIFRESYALLEGIPPERWPTEAKVYPVNDSDNTFVDAAIQIIGRRLHEWVVLPPHPNDPKQHPIDACKHCGEQLTFSQPTPVCPKAPPTPHKNLQDLPAQCLSDFTLELGAAWSFRTDPEKVEELAAEVEAKHAAAVARFQKKGWIREDGTEDQAAVKRAIAIAYGATGTCKKCKGGASCRRCSGTGKTDAGACIHCNGLGKLIGRIQKVDWIECRGVKEKGRYKQGCLGPACLMCGGTRSIAKVGDDVTCKNVFDEGETLIEEGCDGTGLDLSTAPLLPRTDKLGVATDRDTGMESGDEEISDFSENEFEKSRSTFVPYLRKGTTAPLHISANVLVASGRCSYEGCPVHQFPRVGKERGCIRARGAWCGSPVEYVLGSTDYSAGELCTLAQYTYWLFSYSRMLDAINASGDPGILHSELAAEVLGLSLDEFLKRLKAKDPQAIIFRQSSKPMNFGKPAGMGAAKIVTTNRKKNAGFTVCEGGPAVDDDGREGYWGIRFCITVGGRKRCGEEKIISWKGRPTSPVCKACCDAVEQVLTPAYFRRFPEIRDYHKWGQEMIRRKQPVPSVVWDADAGMPKIVRERGFLNYDMELASLLNNGFQSMLADIGKDAFSTAQEECYLGVKADGSPSPLAGSRMILFFHDEPVSEIVLSKLKDAGPRIGEIMVASGKKFAPDVKAWKAETAAAFWLNKKMEPKYNEQKELIPWGPMPEYLKMAA